MRFVLSCVLVLAACVAVAQSSPEFRKTWKVVHVDSSERGDGSPQGAIDGDPMTFWHTQWYRAQPPHPHDIVVDMGRAVSISGFRYLPRQAKAGGQANGRIDRFQFLVSADGSNWTQMARGHFPESGAWFTNRFTAATTARFFQLVAWSSFQGQPFTAVGEIDIVPAGK